MKPEEKGRFCGSCAKTVIDFSLMSDREVLGYLATVSGKVCGRFTEDQLQRELMPPPQRKSKAWVVWNILLAGLLVASRTRGQSKPPVNSQQAPLGKPANPVKIPKPVVMGAPVRMVMGKMAARPLPLITGEVATVRHDDTTAVPVSIPVMMGLVALAPEKDEADTAPHYQELPPVVVNCYSTTRREVIVGGAIASISGDTLAAIATPSAVSQFISDSLTLLGIGKKAFALYPNPAPRGTVIKLSLNLNRTGKYTVGLYNAAGVLLQDKAIELDANSRVELFSLPGSLPGGIYFVKLSAPGEGKVYTQKMIVW